MSIRIPTDKVQFLGKDYIFYVHKNKYYIKHLSGSADNTYDASIINDLIDSKNLRLLAISESYDDYMQNDCKYLISQIIYRKDDPTSANLDNQVAILVIDQNDLYLIFQESVNYVFYEKENMIEYSYIIKFIKLVFASKELEVHSELEIHTPNVMQRCNTYVYTHDAPNAHSAHNEYDRISKPKIFVTSDTKKLILYNGTIDEECSHRKHKITYYSVIINLRDMSFRSFINYTIGKINLAGINTIIFLSNDTTIDPKSGKKSLVYDVAADLIYHEAGHYSMREHDNYFIFEPNTSTLTLNDKISHTYIISKN